jgi:hypothetical protein
LYANGFKRQSDIKYATLEELSKIHQIGRTLAQDILLQVSCAASAPPNTAPIPGS